MLKVLDPRQFAEGEPLVMAPPLGTLEGAVVGLLDNAKIGTATFYDHLEAVLKSRGVRDVVRRRKPDSSRPAPETMMGELSAADAVVSGIGD
jgi:hypothetical protein